MANPTNTTRHPTSHIAPFGVRMQPELKAQLEAAAKKTGRSMNSEIVARLERSLFSDPLSADPAQLQISIPDRLYNKLRAAAVENGSLPNDEISDRLEASFDLRPSNSSASPALRQALRLSDAQAVFAGILAILCRNIFEMHSPESLGWTQRAYDSARRVLSKTVHNTDFDDADLTELIGVAHILGAIKSKNWPPS